MTTTLTQCGWTWSDILTRRIVLADLHAQSLLNQVRIKLACTRQLTCETTFDDGVAWHDATHLILDEGLTFLGNQYELAIVRHTTNQLLRDRIL